eukprot:jgi/Botrbrau1/19462/Bobra.0338s0082.1
MIFSVCSLLIVLERGGHIVSVQLTPSCCGEARLRPRVSQRQDPLPCSVKYFLKKIGCVSDIDMLGTTVLARSEREPSFRPCRFFHSFSRFCLSLTCDLGLRGMGSCVGRKVPDGSTPPQNIPFQMMVWGVPMVPRYPKTGNYGRRFPEVLQHRQDKNY